MEESYDKEYGKDTVQIHKDALNENDVVLLHDDLLATGGTMKAACNLVKKLHPKKVYVNFIIELKELNGKQVFENDQDVDINKMNIFAGHSDNRYALFSWIQIKNLKPANI